MEPDRARAVLAVGVDPGPLDGFVVESADELLGALAHLADGGVDVVLAALEHPDAAGEDVVRSLRERAPDSGLERVVVSVDAQVSLRHRR